MGWVRRIGKWFVILGLSLIAGGASYQQVGVALDAALAPPKSEMAAVSGRAIHVRCMGAGAQTFVLDAGLGVWSFEWFRLQPLLAKWARVCAFDRPGMGWSEDLGGAHDGVAVADELSAVISRAGIPKPFIYVGHSLGANFAQIYYARHPGDVAGLVLLEPGDPKDMLEDFHGTRAEAMRTPDCGAMCAVASVMGHLGIARLAAVILDPGGKSLPADVQTGYRAGLARASTLRAMVGYLGALPKTAYQNMEVKNFADMPVLLICSSRPREPEGDETPHDVEVWLQGYRAYLGSLAAQSSKGEGPVVVPDSTHGSMVTGAAQAAWVGDAIHAFAARGRDVN